MRKDTANFIQSAEYDLETAKHMFNSGGYIYVIFMCHLCIEKISKAICAETIKKTPPKTHNIIYLFKIGKIQLPEELFEFVAKINNASVVTRYPEDFQELLKAYPQEIAREYLSKTE
ncbi:HEPN domain-containing protein [Candidatus Calescamantes bacterium]|nr:HEPN domain-containing protein [Candidatus Calescamantes bacterium]